MDLACFGVVKLAGYSAQAFEGVASLQIIGPEVAYLPNLLLHSLEWLPLKVLHFGFQRFTGPSSKVVASGFSLERVSEALRLADEFKRLSAR